MHKLLTALLIVPCLLFAACSPEPAAPSAPDAEGDNRLQALQQKVDELTERLDSMTPELAVLMSQAQIQHAKLYYAGQSRNWELAAYSLHEMNEALQAVQLFEDRIQEFPTPLTELVPSLVGPPLGEIHGAIRAKDAARFDTAFRSLTQSCNACHATLGHGFIQVQAPTAREFTNQKF